MSDSMRISTLTDKLGTSRIEGAPDAEVTGLFYDSRQVERGGAFFALRGQLTDGHRFIDEALRRGARAIFLERDRPLPADVVKVLVADAREAMAQAAAVFFGDPTAAMPVIGVTGTNGKTTVTYLLESILRRAGKKPAVLGTINYRFDDRRIPAPHTTPEAVDLFGAIDEFRRAGADSLVMEVSSHALDQRRVEAVRFAVGVFTNLTPEHLDYHGDMETYFASKERFFLGLLASSAGRAAINIDDPYGRRLAAELPEALTCGRAEDAQVRPRQVELSLAGIEGVLDTPQGVVPLRSPLLGEFNLQNLLCAAAAGLALGLDPETVAAGLAEAPQIPGRMERIENNLGGLALVDYAHTADALEKALLAVRDLSPRRIITVFGCGGDRDRGKRPRMGEVASRYSDLVVLTSDNPRSEDPLAILEEIRPGVQRPGMEEMSEEECLAGDQKGYIVIPERREAIDFAVRALQPEDLLLLAGKGHEDYQVVGSRRFHFDDREELRQALDRREAESCS